MRLYPDFAEFAERYKNGEPQAVWTRLVADLETPVSAMLKIAAHKPMSFLLESVEGGTVRGRYSVIGFAPDIIWRARDDHAEINRTPGRSLHKFTACKGGTLESLRALLADSSRLFRSEGLERVHYEGARYIFQHPEFSADAAPLGRIFDSEDVLADVLRSPSRASGVSITIGHENSLKEMRRMSLVVATYRVGRGVGRMGVIGPTRMRYPRLVGLLEYFSGALDEMFAGRA